jgi:hypothetical protein
MNLICRMPTTLSLQNKSPDGLPTVYLPGKVLCMRSFPSACVLGFNDESPLRILFGLDLDVVVRSLGIPSSLGLEGMHTHTIGSQPG